MILTLEVTSAQARELGASHRKVFKAIGGTIGRLPDNDWVFPDPYVSGRHALIRYVNSRFFVEDTSTNGVFINSMDDRLARGQPRQLSDGDSLYIDAYKINVSIQAGEDRTANLLPTRPPAEPRPPSTAALPAQRTRFATDKPSRPQAPEPRRRTPPQVTRLKPAPSSDSAQHLQLQALFDAAGIEGLDPSTEAAQTLGAMLRVALGGIMEALRTRERMKDDLRMRGTTFKEADNNPLKFSANVDDAFHNLLVKQNPAYLQPVDAFEDAFHDVRHHQAALPAAMRLAFESMLSQFDPQRLQEEFDRQMKGSILGVPAKMRYWDLYRDKYGELIKDAEAGFRTLFGDAFAREYQEHLERQKPSGRSVGQ